MSKKGQTLVEVTVALGIIAMVFAGTVTLVVRVVGLEISARDRTEATAYSQKVLNMAVAQLKTGCSEVSDVTVKIPDPPERFVGTRATVSCINVSESNIDSETGGPCDSSALGLLKVTTTFDWSSRDTGTENYTISQLVRKDQ